MKRRGYSDDMLIEKFESKILKLGNEELSSFIAENVRGANIKSHEKVIIDSKDLRRNYFLLKILKE